MLLQILLSLLPWALVLAAAWLLWQLIRQNGRILLRLDALELQLDELASDRPGAPAAAPGLRLGSPAPDFGIPDLSGATRGLSEWKGRPALLVFFDPKCGFCRQLAPALAALPSPAPGNNPVLVLISRGSVDENRALVEKHGLQCPVLIEPEGAETSKRYQTRGTPMGYLVDAEGRIAGELAVGAEALLALAASSRGPAPFGRALDGGNGTNGAHEGHPHRGNRPLSESRINRSGLPPGTAAPDFRLPLLGGGEVALSDYRGRRTLLVFSDPNCGPCDQLAPHLDAAWREVSGPRILLVSRGDEDANRQKSNRLGLTLPIALQRQWEVSKQFGMFATPIAYLIDAAGSIEAEVAVGVEPILKLLGKGNAACPVVPASAAKEAAPTRT
jgi:peroxiredoxin